MNEPNLQHIVLIYLAVINVVTFFMYGVDKWKAKRSKWRIPEATLLLMAVIGGSIGAWLGMKVWHHKTLHKGGNRDVDNIVGGHQFRYGVPLILIAQIALLFLCSCKTKQHIEIAMPIHHEYTPEHSSNVFLIMYDAEIGKDPLLKAIKEYKCEIVYDYGIINGMALKKPANKTLEETMQYFKTVKGVMHVEYDHVYRLTDPVKPRLEIQ